MPIPAVAGLHQYFMSTPCLLQPIEAAEYATNTAAGVEFTPVTVKPTEAAMGATKRWDLASSPDKTYQFLPYRNDQLTYTKVDGDSKVFLTGPLSGCHVYVAKKGGDYYVFHVNSNKNGDNFEKNIEAKREMFMKAAGQLGINPSGVGSVERQQYSKDESVVGGLVFGFDDAAHGSWRFFFSGFNGNGKVTLFFPLHVFNE